VQPGPATTATVGGRPGFYHTLSGINPRGVPARLFVSAAPLGQGSIATITSVPQAEFEADKAALQFIESSFVIGGGAPSPAGTAGSGAAGGVGPPMPGVPPVAAGATLDWLKPGLRITYYVASATVNSARTETVLDEKGEWVYVDSGLKNTDIEKPGASGQGFLQINVVGSTRETIALELRNYGVDVGTGMIRLPTPDGWVGATNGESEYWMNPAALRQMKDQKTKDVSVMHVPCTINGRTYQAVRIYARTSGGSSSKTYDLESGVVLMGGLSGTGASFKHGEGTTVGTSVGGTMLAEMRLVSIRPVNLPWNGMPAPDWVGRTASLTYAGTQSVTLPGSPVTSIPFSAEFKFVRTGPGWAQWTEHDITQGMMGLPPQEASSNRVAGTSQTAGLWIPPQVLARLTPGVIDEDPTTHARFAFVGMRGDNAQFTENTPQTTFELAYNRATGTLVEFAQSMQVGPVTMRVHGSLQRR
jgi:hypothetical protein